MCSACILLCAQFPAQLQAEGTRRLPQRQAGASRQFVGGSPRQVYPRHDGETTDIESSLEREVSIVSKHLNGVIRLNGGADKFLALPGRKQATATKDFEFHIFYL